MTCLKLYGLRALLGHKCFRNVKILIAGGAGYLGGRLAEHLSNIGHEVVVFTRQDQNNFSGTKYLKYVEVDWSNFSEVLNNFQNADVVINATGMTSSESLQDPEGANNFDEVVTKKLINASLQVRIKLFIQISSIHVYGKNLNGKVLESNEIYGTSAYARRHAQSENLVTRSALPRTLVLRISNIFGPPSTTNGDCWNLIANGMCRDAILSKIISLRSTGNQLRNFIPISEVTKRVENIIESDNQDELPATLNFAGESTLTIIDMAKMIQLRCQKLFGFSPEIVIGQIDDNEDISNFVYSSLYSKNLPKYKSVSIENELDATLNYVMNKIS